MGGPSKISGPFRQMLESRTRDEPGLEFDVTVYLPLGQHDTSDLDGLITEERLPLSRIVDHTDPRSNVTLYKGSLTKSQIELLAESDYVRAIQHDGGSRSTGWGNHAKYD